MKNSKKVTAAVLAGTLSLTLVIPVSAADTPSEKEEVVYINLDAEGSVKNINVVNIFGRGDIIDYGDYDSVELMNTDDKISQDGDKVSFSTESDRVYYKGTMNEKEIPWNISVRYYLDGKEYSADELAGKTGELEIRLKITENERCQGDFYENYALQASFTLDTEKCTHITAEDATVANVGNKKQISYTLLPGKGMDAIVTADVKDFAMSAISVNGIPLSLNVEVDDEELMEQVTELLDAIERIDDGTGELQSGAEKLQSGAKGDLKSGVDELNQGAGQLQSRAYELQSGGSNLQDGASGLKNGSASLNSGLSTLNTGILQVQNGLNELNAKSPELVEGSAEVSAALAKIQNALNGVSVSADELEKLSASSTEILNGITSLSEGILTLYNTVNVDGYKAAMKGENGQGVDELKAANSTAIEQIRPLVAQLDEMIGQLEQYKEIPVVGNSVVQIINLLNKVKEPLSNLTTLLEKNNQCIDGTQMYVSEVNKNMKPLVEGAVSLKENYTAFDQAIQELTGTLAGMLQNVTELQEGVNTLVTESEKLDTGINSYTSGVAQIVAGYSQVSNGSASLVKGSVQLAEGSSAMYDGTTELLSGIAEFYDATGSLKDGTGKLDEGVEELLVGIAALNDGTGALKDGTGELRDKTSGMDTQITDRIDEMLESITGDGDKIVSFVSEKNTNVDSVQFVIQTEAIEEKQEEEVKSTERESLTIWEKVLHLFGID